MFSHGCEKTKFEVKANSITTIDNHTTVQARGRVNCVTFVSMHLTTNHVATSPPPPRWSVDESKKSAVTCSLAYL